MTTNVIYHQGGEKSTVLTEGESRVIIQSGIEMCRKILTAVQRLVVFAVERSKITIPPNDRAQFSAVILAAVSTTK